MNEWYEDVYAVGETTFVVKRDNTYNVYNTHKNQFLFSPWEELIWSTGIFDYYVIKRDGRYNVYNIETGDDKYVIGLDSISKTNLFGIFIVQRNGKWNLLDLTKRSFILDEWYDSISVRRNDPTFFNVVKSGEKGVVNVFGKEFMTMAQYESYCQDSFQLTQEMNDNLPVLDEEEYTQEDIEADVDSIVDDIMKELDS